MAEDRAGGRREWYRFDALHGDSSRRLVLWARASSSHPDVVRAAHEGLDERGYGLSSVRFIRGTQDIHRILEQRLTAFLGTEDTLLFPSCMDANAGVFEAVLGEQDVMIADRLVH